MSTMDRNAAAVTTRLASAVSAKGEVVRANSVVRYATEERTPSVVTVNSDAAVFTPIF